MAIKGTVLNRLPFLSKEQKSALSGEKKNRRISGAAPSQNGDDDGQSSDDTNDRSLFFNLPLPPDLVDDESGAPIQVFARNKIRTAKYTPLSFIPKNLWFQFHNVANIFFLFTVILVCFPIFGGVNPGLNAVPLIVILTITAIKDAIEDSRRTILDDVLNNAPVHRLRNWTNVNVAEGNVSTWRKLKKWTSHSFRNLWTLMQSAWSKKAKEERARSKAPPTVDPRMSTETRRSRNRNSMASPRSNRESFFSAREDIQMTPVPSPLPPQSDAEDAEEREQKRALMLRKMQKDLINHDRPATRKARFQPDAWKNVVVGDFVRIYNNDELPADVVILSTSDEEGGCFVETKNLDGETNLKPRHAPQCGRTLRHARDCERAEFQVESEGPHPNLYKYHGAIKWRQRLPDDPFGEPEEMTEPITIDNLLLRGCTLRNTEWVLGVVVFTGHDTKIMMNAGVTPSKRARIARELNFSVICNFIVLLMICLIAALVNGFTWGSKDSSHTFFEFGTIGGSPAMSGFITYWAAIIMYQNLVPISLYITLEAVRVLQAIFIYSDVEMYYEPIDQPCIPKSWNISDDVGQIEYIFSDKTGTLTQNVMEFKKATINGQPYGEAYTEAQAGMQKRLGVDVEAEGEKARKDIAAAKVKALKGLRAIHENPFLHDEDLTFIAPDFVSDLAGETTPEQKHANERFMLALALCHNVVAERAPGDPPRMIFKAQSPDEAALVATARDMGFTVLSATSEKVELNVMGEHRTYKILTTIEFDSTRKRMSVIVRMPDGQIVLFCKGADSIIYSRLKKGEQKELRLTTAEHLEMFAREGLRTLCIAERTLSESEFVMWSQKYEAAAAAMENREEKMEAMADVIEQDLMLIGGTAIEDRLQDGVPDTIELLGRAGIKLWVLTGDKVETAINIGFSCNLLNNDLELIHLKVDEDDDVGDSGDHFVRALEKELDEHLATFGMTGSDEELAAAKKSHEPPPPTHGLVIDGFTLKWVLHDDIRQKFLLLCKQCKAVLCCRVSPAQKAAVVSLVKNSLDVMTLSIGDGANDVAMIQEADVGVGIAGLEGRQAAMSSDYAIAQFRFLQRLVLVHGRWSYRRLAECIPNFFYKNIIWVFAIFWFGIYSDFDMTYVFEYSYILMFNLLFTSLPVSVMGIIDQDVSDKISLAVPQLYRRGIERLEWTQLKFWLYMIDGVYQSVMVFYIPYLAFQSTFISVNGLDVEDLLRLGAYIVHPAILTINLYILINTYRWDWLILGTIAFSDLFVFFWTAVYTQFTSAAMMYKAAQQIYQQPSFWAIMIIIPVICIFPRFAIKALQKVYYPYDVDIIREQATLGQFDHLEPGKTRKGGAADGAGHAEMMTPDSSTSYGKSKHVAYGSVDEDRRPIYPPSVVTETTGKYHMRSQTGSDSTNYTNPRLSLDETNVNRARPSIDRARPSFDRIRASMDRVRPSFEASSDFTSAARLTLIESTHSGRFRPRLRALSQLSKATHHSHHHNQDN
ncbi:related to ATPase II [Cephalotrichum gorgonifer]|uniref:Phospholipid-transporting ATPase n=1 Tax=Cephalotrichum gorgonifer TaxID=2041049 RepID=A0AAE8MT69_9PEZI|nr:related to ATPase II [Cephalotrichum gorgonifer]